MASPHESTNYRLSIRLLDTCSFFEHICRNRLRTLDTVAESTVPSDVGETAESTTDTEQDGVEFVLGDAIVPLDYAGLCINIRPWVFRFAMLGQNVRSDFEDHLDQLEQRVVFQPFGLQTELALRGVARVGLAQTAWP